MNFKKIKGTQDFWGNDIIKKRFVENTARNIVSNSGFSEIETPIFESTDVFLRIGEETDIVNKEMYTFKDKGNRSITLRPEGTAGVARSFLENKLYANNLPFTKLFYNGPMFRYERPQAGRYRQFQQFGVEVFGEITPLLDSDVIMTAYNIFKKLKIKNVKLKINSIGDFASREKYTIALKEYFTKHLDKLCSDCNRRIETNPLRILDCKIDQDSEVLKHAPKISSYLTKEAKEYFDDVLKNLDYFKINYELDEKLVRGLDYYTDTVFEFIIESTDQLNGLALCAGGKYADLITSFNGMDIPGTGYAFGVERIIAIMDEQNCWLEEMQDQLDILIISLDSESKLLSLDIANNLRMKDYRVEIDYKNYKMKQQFKLADKLNPQYIIIIGEEERKQKLISIKNTKTKIQETIKQDSLITYLEKNNENT